MTKADNAKTGGRFRPGAWVVYRKTKFGTTPGPRAKAVAPAEHGDLYSYLVEKYWIVTGVASDGRLQLRTRKGKQRLVSAGDSNLRPARWWERLLRRDRFRDAERAAAADAGTTPDRSTPAAPPH